MTTKSISSHHLSIEKLLSPLFPLAKQFYKHAKYHSHIGREDEVYVIRDETQNNQIIAAVRLVRMSDYLILRSMVVSPNRRGEGVGKVLLKYLRPAIGDRECWCFPFEWLETLYASIGFSTIENKHCPPDILQKYLQYISQGRKLLIMSLTHA